MIKAKAQPLGQGMDTTEKSRRIAAVLDEKQAENVLVLDVSGICPITEHLIIASGRGQRHAQGLADAVLALASDEKMAHFGMEGYQAGTWILVDLNDVIIHIFQDDMRRFFNLEGLWSEGQRIDWQPKAVQES